MCCSRHYPTLAYLPPSISLLHMRPWIALNLCVKNQFMSQQTVLNPLAMNILLNFMSMNMHSMLYAMLSDLISTFSCNLVETIAGFILNFLEVFGTIHENIVVCKYWKTKKRIQDLILDLNHKTMRPLMEPENLSMFMGCLQNKKQRRESIEYLNWCAQIGMEHNNKRSLFSIYEKHK